MQSKSHRTATRYFHIRHTLNPASKPQVGASISGEAKLSSDLGGKMPPSFDQDVARVVDDIDRIEANTLSQMEDTALDRQGQVRTLGKLLLFDKHLSVNQNEACSFCHTPETGFTGPIQSLNLTTVSYPGIGENAVQQSESHKAICMRPSRRCSTTMRSRVTL